MHLKIVYQLIVWSQLVSSLLITSYVDFGVRNLAHASASVVRKYGSKMI